MDLHGDALNKIIGDMDDMESKNYGANPGGGATITITVTPSTDSSDEGGGEGAGDLPADHPISMCGGGCAYHKGGVVPGKGADSGFSDLAADKGFAAGGVVTQQPPPMQEDESHLPPFLRKKKQA
jgi:hypothetical protein